MIVENTPAARRLKRAADNLAIEDLYPSAECIKDCLDFEEGKISEEEVIERIRKRYSEEAEGS